MELHDLVGLFIDFGMEGEFLCLFQSLLLLFLPVLLSQSLLPFHHLRVVLVIGPRILWSFGMLVQLFQKLGLFLLLLLLLVLLVFFELFLLLLDDLFVPHVNGLIS